MDRTPWQDTDTIYISQSMFMQIQDFHFTSILLANAQKEILSTQEFGNQQMKSIWWASF